MLRTAGLLALALAWLAAAPAGAEHGGPWHAVERVAVVLDARAGAAGVPGLIGGDALMISGNGRYVTLLGDAPEGFPGCVRIQYCTLNYRYDRDTGTAEPFAVAWNGTYMPSVIFPQPGISHDGRFVVYNEDGLYVRDMMTGEAERVDLDFGGGVPSQGAFDGSRFSGNGRLVAFSSAANDLVPGDNNDCGVFDSCTDIFVRDLDAGTTTRVSVSSSGGQADNSSADPSISADGRYVVFSSIASNLTSEGLNTTCPVGPPGVFACRQVFRHDRVTGETVMVSVDMQGQAPAGNSSEPDVSSDGRYVSFVSTASDLVEGDSGGFTDVFVRDMTTGVTERVSLAPDGGGANGNSSGATISDDGMRVAFGSTARNLDPDGPLQCSPTCRGIFVRERDGNVTYRVDVSAAGESGNGYGQVPKISGDGRHVVYLTNSNNLIPGGSGGNYVSEREQTGPPPREIGWGDVNCGGSLDTVDALFNLRFVAALEVKPQRPCPDIGSQVETLAAALVTWGDVDCSGTVDAVDALKLLRYVASLPVNQPEGCPDIGSTVLIPTTP